MKFGQLVAPASTASDPKSAILAVAPWRWARTGRTRNLCHGLARYLPLPPSFQLSPTPVVVVVVALAVVTSHNPICSLAAIAFGSPRLVASLPTLQSSYFDHSFSDGPRQDRTGVTCGIKYFEEGRSTHSGLDLYVALTHTHTLSLFLSVCGQHVSRPALEAVHQPDIAEGPHRTLVCTLALCHGVGRMPDRHTYTDTHTSASLSSVCRG